MTAKFIQDSFPFIRLSREETINGIQIRWELDITELKMPYQVIKTAQPAGWRQRFTLLP
jgi:hypothetical protein